MGIPLGLGILANLGTLGIPLGLEILGKTTENLENFGTLEVPLGLEILGKTTENLENPFLHLGIWPGLQPPAGAPFLMFPVPESQTCVKRAPGCQ